MEMGWVGNDGGSERERAVELGLIPAGPWTPQPVEPSHGTHCSANVADALSKDYVESQLVNAANAQFHQLERAFRNGYETRKAEERLWREVYLSVSAFAGLIAAVLIIKILAEWAK